MLGVSFVIEYHFPQIQIQEPKPPEEDMTPGYQAQSAAQARKHDQNSLTDGQAVEIKSSWYGSHALLGNLAKHPQKEFYVRSNHVAINMWCGNSTGQDRHHALQNN
jgi:hypothetical protein